LKISEGVSLSDIHEPMITPLVNASDVTVNSSILRDKCRMYRRKDIRRMNSKSIFKSAMNELPNLRSKF
jgi:hypothetical protein